MLCLLFLSVFPENPLVYALDSTSGTTVFGWQQQQNSAPVNSAPVVEQIASVRTSKDSEKDATKALEYFYDLGNESNFTRLSTPQRVGKYTVFARTVVKPNENKRTCVEFRNNINRKHPTLRCVFDMIGMNLLLCLQHFDALWSGRNTFLRAEKIKNVLIPNFEKASSALRRFDAARRALTKEERNRTRGKVWMNHFQVFSKMLQNFSPLIQTTSTVNALALVQQFFELYGFRMTDKDRNLIVEVIPDPDESAKSKAAWQQWQMLEKKIVDGDDSRKAWTDMLTALKEGNVIDSAAFDNNKELAEVLARPTI